MTVAASGVENSVSVLQQRSPHQSRPPEQIHGSVIRASSLFRTRQPCACSVVVILDRDRNALAGRSS